MKDEKSLIKKPSKKERLLAKRAQREQMLKVNMSMNVTLECPKCNVQQIMTLEEYFRKINYGSPFQKVMRCESCEGRPSLQFYKVNKKQIAAAGFNWERQKRGISDEKMLDMLETVDNIHGIINPEAKKKLEEITG